MSWQIDNHPDGGLQITHLDAPRFTARWTTGEFPIDLVREGGFFWTDEGSGEEDAIHLYQFEWDDPVSGDETLQRLVRSAVSTIEASIMGQA